MRRRRWLGQALRHALVPAWRQALGLPLALAAGRAAAATAPGMPLEAAGAPSTTAQGAPGADPAGGPQPTVRRGRRLEFPRDHGAHLAALIEWWYLTGFLGPPEAPSHGLQVTFFRSRTGFGAASASRFAPRQLLFAHAALTDLSAGTHRHAQRIARWSEAPRAPLAHAGLDDAELRIGGWTLQRRGDAYHVVVDSPDVGFALVASRTQPLLLQGDAGWSRKGPAPTQASHYYSEPQLALQARLRGRPATAGGRGWLDHEWSDEILPADAVGWDWIGINLADGGALTAFRLRRADGSALWAGGSLRPAGGAAIAFGPDEVRFEPGARWSSPATGASYPVRWRLRTPAGEHAVHALLDAQELDGRGSTGTIYWEGLAELLDAAGRRVGLGYLEMTGYAGRLRLG